MTRAAQFRIADTFTDSLAKLTGDEQKAVKTGAFDLQMDPSAPSLSFHKLDQAKDKNFWSVRVNRDIRLIVHRTAASVMLGGGTVSAFNGPEPCIRVFGSPDDEAVAVAEWLTARRQDGYARHEIALFVRSETEIPRAQEAVRLAGLSTNVLDGRSDGASDRVILGTMHLAKGLDVCGGDKLDHGSGGICPAAGGVKLCHL